MLNVTSGITNTKRFVVDVADGVVASGIEGLWVVPGASSYDFGASALVAYQVWEASSKDGSVGYHKDVEYLKKATVLEPPYRAITDQFDGSPTLGAKLKTTATGTLAVESSTGAYVAVVTKAPYSYSHLGRTLSVIEIQVGG